MKEYDVVEFTRAIELEGLHIPAGTQGTLLDAYPDNHYLMELGDEFDHATPMVSTEYLKVVWEHKEG